MKKYSQAEINKHLNEAEKIALKIVEQKARKILNEHPNLDEFIMAMGSWFFKDKQGNHLYADEVKYLKSLDNFILNNDQLKLTGTPMRFTAKGKIVRDW